MSYLESKSLYKKDSHDKIKYRIEWDNEALKQDASCHENLFEVTCIPEIGDKELIGAGASVAEAQILIDEHYGDTLKPAIWVHYCCNIQTRNFSYKIYVTYDTANEKYIIAVSRDNGQHIYPYCNLSEDDTFNVQFSNGGNIVSEVLKIAQYDISSGIMDRIFDEQNKFIVDDYIINATELLSRTIWSKQNSYAVFPSITHLCLKALNDKDGTNALPVYSVPGEIELFIKGHVEDNKYEITIRLRLLDGVWKFSYESVTQNDEHIYTRQLCSDGGYVSRLKGKKMCEDSLPYNQSSLKPWLPSCFWDWINNFVS